MQAWSVFFNNLDTLMLYCAAGIPEVSTLYPSFLIFLATFIIYFLFHFTSFSQRLM
jgi:hypothetical protein